MPLGEESTQNDHQPKKQTWVWVDGKKGGRRKGKDWEIRDQNHKGFYFVVEDRREPQVRRR